MLNIPEEIEISGTELHSANSSQKKFHFETLVEFLDMYASMMEIFSLFICVRMGTFSTV